MLGLISPRTTQEKKWHRYADEVFGSIEQFIVQNKLEHYLIDKKVDMFWDRKSKFKEATDEEWKKYFEKAESKISYRNEVLNIDKN